MQIEQSSSAFQEKITSALTQSLTEEQRFLQDVLDGKIKLIPHDEVMRKLDSFPQNFPFL